MLLLLCASHLFYVYNNIYMICNMITLHMIMIIYDYIYMICNILHGLQYCMIYFGMMQVVKK